MQCREPNLTPKLSILKHWRAPVDSLPFAGRHGKGEMEIGQCRGSRLWPWELA